MTSTLPSPSAGQEILPCPFCGADGQAFDVHTLTWHVRYGCQQCQVFFNDAETWNTRAALTSASKQARGEPLVEVDEATALKGGRWVSADDIEQMVGELMTLATGEAFRPVKMVDAFHTLKTALAAPQTQQAEPLTLAQLNEAARDAQIDFCMGKEASFEVAFARRIEAAHRIKAVQPSQRNGGCGNGESEHG